MAHCTWFVLSNPGSALWLCSRLCKLEVADVMRTGASVLCTLLVAFDARAAQEAAPSPNPEQFQRFVTRMVELLPSAERERIGLPSACPAYDGTWICPWTGSYSQGFDICGALRKGYSRDCVGRLLLAEIDPAIRDAWIDGSVEVICPDLRSGGGRPQLPQPEPDSTQERVFIDSMIERLPEDTRECYRELCRTYDRELCPLWGMSSLGDAVCEAFASGQSRAEVLEASQGFYEESELAAIVDTAVEVICPEYRGKE